MSVISYPIPAYQNVPIQSNYFQPSVFVISGVTLGVTTTVTTTMNHNYIVGQLVRLTIPPTYGCRQLNEQQGYVLSISDANQVVLNIDSSKNVDQFISSSATTQPQIMAIGDINTGQTNANGPFFVNTFVPGSFQNISPQ